jgi:predicted CXXCH cytochrome family protein
MKMKMFSDKRSLKAMPAVTVLLFCLSTQAVWGGTIFGSPHDFRPSTWNRGGEICLPCHAPHQTKTLPAPLWNLALSNDTYSMYTRTPAPAGNIKPGSLPDGLSKKCLSCHDGIEASDVYGGHTGGSAEHFGRDLARAVPVNNHPISFVYDSDVAAKNKDLYDPSRRRSGVAGSTGSITTDMLFFRRMECTSCHDVHNTKAVPGTKLLVKDTAGSALCLTCHNK